MPYSEEDLWGALERAHADKNEEAARVIAEEIQKLKAAPAPKPDDPLSALNAEGFEAQSAEPDRTSGKEAVTGLLKTVPRLLSGVNEVNPLTHIARMYDRIHGDSSIVKNFLEGQQGLTELGRPPETTAGRIGGILGDVAVSSLAPTSGVRGIIGQSLMGGMLAPEDHRLLGGVAGGLGAAAGLGAKVGLGPFAQPEARALMNEGIQPSVGQALGGTFNKMESGLTSLPFVGDAAHWARYRPLDEVQEMAVNRAIGNKPEALDAVRGNLDRANRYASDLFNEVVPHFVPTREAVLNVQGAVRRAVQNPEIRPDDMTMLSKIVSKNFQNFGQLRGEQIQSLDRELGYLARKYSRKGDPHEEALAEEFYNIQDALRKGIEVGLPPDVRGLYREATSTYRNLIPLNKAASSRADQRILPRSLQKQLARQAHTDVTRLPPDPLLDPSVGLLPADLPDTGTATRAYWLGSRLGLGGGAAAGASSMGLFPQLMGTTGLSFAGASRPAQAAILGNTALQRWMEPGYVGALTSALTNN